MRKRKGGYKLDSLSKDAGGRFRRGPREQYPTDTIDIIGHANRSVERILPPDQIRKTVDVNISHDDHRDEKATGTYLHRFAEV